MNKNTLSVHAKEKFVYDVSSHVYPSHVYRTSARVTGLNYLELHVRSKISAYQIQSFLLLKHFKCISFSKTICRWWPLRIMCQFYRGLC